MTLAIVGGLVGAGLEAGGVIGGTMLGDAAAGMAIGAGVGTATGMSGGNTTNPQAAAAQADPFAQYRPQYGAQIQDLMNNPSSVQNLPGYQAQMNQGIQAVQRGDAAQGKSLSGQEQIDLQNLGQSQQSSYFNTYLQQLMNLSGANQNPAAGWNAANQATQNQTNAYGQIAGGLSNLSSIYGNSGVGGGSSGGSSGDSIVYTGGMNDYFNTSGGYSPTGGLPSIGLGDY